MRTILVAVGLLIFSCSTAKQNESTDQSQNSKETTKMHAKLEDRLIGKWMIDIEKTYMNNPTFRKGIEEKDEMVMRLMDVFSERLFVEFTREGQQIFTSVTVPSLEPVKITSNYKILSVKNGSIHLFVEKDDGKAEKTSVEFRKNGDIVWLSKAEPTGRFLKKHD